MFSYTGNSESLVVTQRIGRALRISSENPNKRANIFDFYWEDASPQSSEMQRVEWLDDISSYEVEVAP